MPQHATRTSFKPGQIANPNGRNGGGGKPAVPAEVLDACRAYSLPAVQTLVELLNDRSSAIRLAACNALLDRAWGKPEQTMNLAGGIDINEQRAETEAMVEAMKRLDITELRMLIGFYRKAGLALPGETTE